MIITLLLKDGREPTLADCHTADDGEAMLRLAEQTGEKLGGEVDPADVVEIRSYDDEEAD